jgi:ATP-dependent Clp protease protease subunit
MCASMASLILIYGKKGMRYVLPNSEVLIHQPLGGTQGQASDMLIHAEHLQKTKEKIIKIYHIV